MPGLTSKINIFTHYPKKTIGKYISNQGKFLNCRKGQFYLSRFLRYLSLRFLEVFYRETGIVGKARWGMIYNKSPQTDLNLGCSNHSVNVLNPEATKAARLWGFLPPSQYSDGKQNFLYGAHSTELSW